MKIVIPGGSGHLGTLLARSFRNEGHEVVVLSRTPQVGPWRTVFWDGKTVAAWASEIDGADVVINLAGRSVHCRYNDKAKREILESRVLATRAIGEAIARAKQPPRVWLQASTATIYAHRFDEANDERTGIRGGHETGVPADWKFSIDVAAAWEAVVDAAIVPATRKVKLRTAVVMSPEHNGAFDQYLRLVRLGVGGTHGKGTQYVSWIHYDDFYRAIRFLIDRSDLAGAVNVAAPEPLPNAEFLRVMREAWGIRLGIPAPEWLLEIASFLHRTETELLLKSRRVAPRRLLESGFRFRFPSWPDAARDLVAEWRVRHGRADARRIDAPSY
ncbi:MAG: TIGR01777 family oxidoreductase [Thermoanaerobaculia bacterium]